MTAPKEIALALKVSVHPPVWPMSAAPSQTGRPRSVRTQRFIARSTSMASCPLAKYARWTTFHRWP